MPYPRSGADQKTEQVAENPAGQPAPVVQFEGEPAGTGKPGFSLLAKWRPFGAAVDVDEDGDWTPLQADGDGALYVKVLGTISTSAVSANGRPLVFYYDPEGFSFPVFPETEFQTRAGQWGAQHVQLRDETSGDEVGTSDAPLRVDPTGGTPQPVTGAVDIGNTVDTESADGAHVALGATTDAEALGNGSAIALLKRLRTLLTDPLLAIDDPAGATDKGRVPLAVFRPFGPEVTVSDPGDYVPLSVDGDGALYIKVVGNITTTSGSGDQSRPLVFYYDPEGFSFPVFPETEFQTRAGQYGAQHVQLRDEATGNEVGTADAPLRVDPTGDTTQPVTVATELPAGDNNIGNVDVVTLPSIPAGTNNIGDVDVLTLPSIPAGTNNIGDVDVLSTVTPANRTASGTLTGVGQSVTLACPGCTTLTVQITGTWTGANVDLYGSNDGTNWQPVYGLLDDAFSSMWYGYFSRWSSNGIVTVPLGGHQHFKAELQALSSGSVGILVSATTGTRGLLTAAGIYNLSDNSIQPIFSANTANGTSGTGIPASGITGWDSASSFYRRLLCSATGELHVQAGSFATTISANFTRPANTTAYAAGDAVTNSTSAPVVITFADAARANGGTGRIQSVVLIDSANQATKGQFELWLFDTTFTPDNDNSPFTPTDAECATVVDIISLTTAFAGDATSGAGGNAVFRASGLNIPFKCGALSTSLFGALVVRNAYTPVSGETFTVRLGIVRD